MTLSLFLKPYDIPQAYRDLVKTGIDKLVEAGVLSRVDESKWGAPSFIMPDFNQNLYPCCSLILAPLFKLTGQYKNQAFDWTLKCKTAFNKMKNTIFVEFK